jgi:hypothetical protein
MTAPHGPKRFFSRFSFVSLFVILCVWVLVAPILDHWPFGDVVVAVVFYFALLIGIDATVHSKRWRRIATIGLIYLMAQSVGVALAGETYHGIAARLALLNLIYIVAIPFLMTRHVLTAPRVTTNMIFGGLCAYFLLAICWGQSFYILHQLNPMAFNFGSDAPDLSTVLYFSYTTLTTLGYGDLTPQSELARSLATMEAFTGQIYLAVLVARLVSLHTTAASSAEVSDASDPERT